MGKLQTQLDDLQIQHKQMIKDFYLILGTLQNHRFVRLRDDLEIEPILNPDPNPTCIELDLTTGYCDAEGSNHYKKPCAFGGWFRDCISFRGLRGELPELYEKYNKTPDQMENLKVPPHENNQK